MNKKFQNTERISEAELDSVNGGALPAVLVAVGKFAGEVAIGYVVEKAAEKVMPYVVDAVESGYEKVKNMVDPERRPRQLSRRRFVHPLKARGLW